MLQRFHGIVIRSLLVSRDIDIHRATRNVAFELKHFSLDDLERMLSCLDRYPSTPGSRYPCGPVFNKHRAALPIWLRGLVWPFLLAGTAALLPLQIGAGMVFVMQGRFHALAAEIPTPTRLLFGLYSDVFSFVKAPLPLVREAVRRDAALCVNGAGQFSVRSGGHADGYAVMSHVWGETMGWRTPEAWGPVELSVRKRGVAYAHFRRFFDRCGAESLWIDVLAMPEVLEDMTPAQKDEAEVLRLGVINCFRSIVTRADCVVVLDSVLLRLRSCSPVDIAVALCLGEWMARLWTYVEARLAKKVVLKTRDASFDLDTVIEFFGRTVLNEEDRYYNLLRRLWPLRDVEKTGVVWDETSTMKCACMGCENRYTNVELDSVRILFPLFDMEWERGWTLQEGLLRLVEEHPEEKCIQQWCDYRKIRFPG